jgi:WD40 repeat protein
VQTSPSNIAIATGGLNKSSKIYLFNLLTQQQVHCLKTGHDNMIDVMVAIPHKNWVVSVGRDKCIFVWKFINHHLVKYLEIL